MAALRELRDPRSFDALVAALPLYTNTAATALQELGDPRAIPYLVAALINMDVGKIVQRPPDQNAEFVRVILATAAHAAPLPEAPAASAAP